MKLSLIYTELTRYVRNCTDELQYLILRRKLYQHMCARGYKHHIIAPVFDQYTDLYSKRHQLLYSNKSTNSTTIHTNNNKIQSVDMYLSMIYDPVTRYSNINDVLHQYHSILYTNPITAKLFSRAVKSTHKRARTLQSMLIRARYNRTPATTNIM